MTQCLARASWPQQSFSPKAVAPRSAQTPPTPILRQMTCVKNQRNGEAHGSVGRRADDRQSFVGSAVGASSSLQVPMLHFGGGGCIDESSTLKREPQTSVSVKASGQQREQIAGKTPPRVRLQAVSVDIARASTPLGIRAPLSVSADEVGQFRKDCGKNTYMDDHNIRDAGGSVLPGARDASDADIGFPLELHPKFIYRPQTAPSLDHSPSNSPVPLSVYPADDGCADVDKTTPAENDNHCSTIPSNPSLTSEQERAYNEAEQAAMACEVKRMENCLAEERERSAMLQKTFAMELMAQKDAHARDITALEAMIGKVLADNRRLSGIVEGLCGQAEQSRDIVSGSDRDSRTSTSASGTPKGASKRSPNHSDSNGDETSSSSRPRSRGLRLRALERDRGLYGGSPQPASSEGEANGSSHHPASSEAEQTTDSEPIPSSAGEAAQPALAQVPAARRAIYTAVD